eukprot:jgi/Mesvir1/29124/Mv18427-RA.1
MGYAAVVATVLRKKKTQPKEERRGTKISSSVWNDFWRLRSPGSSTKPGQAESDANAPRPRAGSPTASNSISGDVAISASHAMDATATFPHGEFIPPLVAEGSTLEHLPAVGMAGHTTNNSKSQLVESDKSACPRPESDHEASVAGAEACAGAVYGNKANDERYAAYRSLICGLREQYKGILRRRTNYLYLLSFVLLTAFYSTILIYQRRAFLAYDIHKSLAYLLPNDDNGGVVSEFRDATYVYDWLEATVQDVWVDPFCGNGVCDVPVEEAAYVRFGCQEDCGWREDLMQLTLDLSYFFPSAADPSVRATTLWNICRKGLCSRVNINPVTSPDPDQPSCLFLNASRFAYIEGRVSATLYLPASTEWEMCLLTHSVILPVAGTVSLVPLSKAERSRRDSDRGGYLGEGPVDTSIASIMPAFGGSSAAALSLNNSQAGGANIKVSQSSLGVARTSDVEDVSGLGARVDGSTVSQGEVGSVRLGNTATGVLRLAEWGFDRQVSYCEFSCLAMARCFSLCPEKKAIEIAAVRNMSLSRFRVSELLDVCFEYQGCAEQPNRSFQAPNLGACADDMDIQNMLKLYAPEINPAILARAYSACIYDSLVVVGTLAGLPSCADDCFLHQVGDSVCNPGCFVDTCEYDLGDCCERTMHFHELDAFARDAHYDCPSNTSHPKQEGGQIFSFGFRLPDFDGSPLVFNTTGGTIDNDPTAPGGVTKTEDYRWRMVGVTNRVIGGIVIKQHRTPLQPSPLGERFRSLFNLDFNTASRARPFGSNPRFLPESDLFKPSLDNRMGEFFTRDELSDQEVPLVFFPITHRGRDVFPVFIDMGATQKQALFTLDYVKKAFYLDTATEEVEVEVVTYNGVLKFFGVMVVRFRRQAGGMVAITSTIQCFSLNLYNTPAERMRGVGELLLVLMMIAGTMSELKQFAKSVAKLEFDSYITSVANIIDLVSISLFYVCIVLWVRFLIKYHGPFDIWLSYQPYRTVYESDDERLAKFLEYSEDGSEMRLLLDTFETVKDISRSVEVYSFLAAFNLLLMMMRLLKLTDFQPRLGIVTHTLTRALNDIMHYLLVAGIMFVCFAIMAHLSFGTTLVEFSTIIDSFNTCFLMVIGEVGINEKLMALQGLQLVIAWIFFWIFIIVMSFILINFFIAFIVDAFAEHMNSGARSTTVVHDLQDVFRDVARLSWARLTCNTGHAHDDAAMAAKLDALARLSKGPSNVRITPSGSYSNYGNGKDVSHEARSAEHAPMPEDARDTQDIYEKGEGVVSGARIRTVGRDSGLNTGQTNSGMTLENPRDNTGVLNRHLADTSAHHTGQGVDAQGDHPGQGAWGVHVGPREISRQHTGQDQASAVSWLRSKFLQGRWHARTPAPVKQHHTTEPQLVINGCAFGEEEVARLLLRGMMASSLAGEGLVAHPLGRRIGYGDMARRRRANASTVLFGSGAAGTGWVHGRHGDISGVDVGSKEKGQGARSAQGGSESRRLGGKLQVDEDVDLESSQPRGALTDIRAPIGASADWDNHMSEDACHTVVAEISRHAIWRFGTSKVDELGGTESAAKAAAGSKEDAGGDLRATAQDKGRDPGLSAVAMLAMPENSMAQITHMIQEVQSQLEKMEARWSSVLSGMLQPGEGQRPLEDSSTLHGMVRGDPAPGAALVEGDGIQGGSDGQAVIGQVAPRRDDQPGRVV